MNPIYAYPVTLLHQFFYNHCLEQYGDKESQRIVSGTKIKIFYLTKKFGRFKSIALPTDIRVLPSWFEEHFVELIDRRSPRASLD